MGVGQRKRVHDIDVVCMRLMLCIDEYCGSVLCITLCITLCIFLLLRMSVVTDACCV